jgi:hypothetical protein
VPKTIRNESIRAERVEGPVHVGVPSPAALDATKHNRSAILNVAKNRALHAKRPRNSAAVSAKTQFSIAVVCVKTRGLARYDMCVTPWGKTPQLKRLMIFVLWPRRPLELGSDRDRRVLRDISFDALTGRGIPSPGLVGHCAPCGRSPAEAPRATRRKTVR